MTFRPILQWPHPKLAIQSEAINKFDPVLVQLVRDMYDTLNITMGAGLAAPQIGVHKRVVILKPHLFGHNNCDPYEGDDRLLVLVNPHLKLKGKKKGWNEECLSLPGVTGKVFRNSDVQLVYQTLGGEEKKLDVGWPFSGALQHECDHLDGLLFIDRMGKRAAIELKKQFRRKIRLNNPFLKKRPKIKEEKEVIDTRLTHGPGKRKRDKRKKLRKK